MRSLVLVLVAFARAHLVGCDLALAGDSNSAGDCADCLALHFIQPGTPVQNASVESFNGKFRDECSNLNWSVSLADAATRIEAWREDYDGHRPDGSLGDLTPEESARRAA